MPNRKCTACGRELTPEDFHSNGVCLPCVMQALKDLGINLDGQAQLKPLIREEE